jgi:hypothetical protein
MCLHAPALRVQHRDVDRPIHRGGSTFVSRGGCRARARSRDLIPVDLLRRAGAICSSRLVPAHDAAGAARCVGVAVAGAGGGADADGLHVGGEGRGSQVGVAACPLDCADWRVRVAGVPEAEVHLHWCLWVLVVAGCGAVVDYGADDGAVDGPRELRGGPVESVGVEAGLRGEACGVLEAAIVVAGYAFAEVVRLDEAAGGGVEVCAREFLGGSVTAVEVSVVPYPVDLIQIFRDQDEAGDDASTWGGLSDDLDGAEEEIEVSPDVGGVISLREGELGPVWTVGHGLIGCKGPVGW